MLNNVVNHNIFLFLFGAYHINYYLCNIKIRNKVLTTKK
nr:MAG TPA: hypothetical protein [Caudoviricetes sp.]